MTKTDTRPAGALALLAGPRASAAAAPALFAPLAIIALALANEPLWASAAALLGAAPLVFAAGAASGRPTPGSVFALAAAPLALSAAGLAWVSGGALSPAAPWTLAALAVIALLGGPRVAWGAAAGAALLGVAAAVGPDAPIRLFAFAARADREVMAAISWAGAAGSVAMVAAAASAAWTEALPPLRRPTILANRALTALASGAGVCALRLRSVGAGPEREERVAQVFGATDKTLGFERDDLRGAPLSALLHPDDLPLVAARIEALRQTGQAPRGGLTVRARTRTGGYRWVEAAPAPAKGLPDLDAGDAVEDADTAALLTLRLRWRPDTLVSDGPTEDQSRFLAVVDDELRAGLKSIVGFTDILRNELFGPIGAERYREYVRLAHDNAEHLLDRVDEMLDLAAVEGGRFELDGDPVEPGPLAEGVLRAVRKRAEAAGVSATIHVAPGAPPLNADRRATRRVVMAMLNDALRRSKMGDTLRLSVNAEDGAVRFAALASAVAGDWPEADGEAAAVHEVDPDSVSSDDAERRLDRLAATSLAELAGGAVMFIDGSEGVVGGERLLSEALFPTVGAGDVARLVDAGALGDAEATAALAPAAVPVEADPRAAASFEDAMLASIGISEPVSLDWSSSIAAPKSMSRLETPPPAPLDPAEAAAEAELSGGAARARARRAAQEPSDDDGLRPGDIPDFQGGLSDPLFDLAPPDPSADPDNAHDVSVDDLDEAQAESQLAKRLKRRLTAS